MKNLNKIFLSLLIVVISSQSWGWGRKGHEAIETVAAQLLPNTPFSQLLKNNLVSMRFLAMVPDMNWKHGSEPHQLEGQSHFFAVEFYSPRGGALNPNIDFYIERAGLPAVLKGGTVPWRIQEMAVLLVKALKKQNVNPVEVLQIAATLGHYVGDAGNPLHLSLDYDGAGVGRRGLHSFFETKTVNLIPDDELLGTMTQLATPLLQKIPNNIVPIQGAFNLATAGFRYEKPLLSAAKSLGLSQALQAKVKPMIFTTLANSSAMLAKIWNEAFVVAGSPQFTSQILGQVGVPAWAPVTYLKGANSR